MALLAKLTALITAINSAVLWFGRQVAWIAIAVMVAVILLQVFYRYVLNAALPWPEEAARAMMIWMMAFIAPSAYRWGGFVSIDMLHDILPQGLVKIIKLGILLIGTIVLILLLQNAINHFNSGFLFRSSTLKIPLAWIYLAMSVCAGLMLSVNIELILRYIGRTFGNPEDFPEPPEPKFISAS